MTQDGRSFLLIAMFLLVWFGCVAAGVLIPMITIHDDVSKVFSMGVFGLLGFVCGPVLGYLVIRELGQ